MSTSASVKIGATSENPYEGALQNTPKLARPLARSLARLSTTHPPPHVLSPPPVPAPPAKHAPLDLAPVTASGFLDQRLLHYKPALDVHRPMEYSDLMGI